MDVSYACFCGPVQFYVRLSSLECIQVDIMMKKKNIKILVNLVEILIKEFLTLISLVIF